MSKYHQALQKQIDETLGPNPVLPDNIEDLLGKISQSYETVSKEFHQMEGTIKLRTDQLITSTSRAYSFFDSINLGLVICDIERRFVLINSSLKDILKESLTNAKREIQDWSLDTVKSFFSEDFDLDKSINDSIELSKPVEVKEILAGKKTLHLYIAPMGTFSSSDSDSKIIGSVMLVEDITEQKNLEHAKDEFLSIASHELRTPLTAIRGNTSMLLKYYKDKINNEEIEEMISDIYDSSVRLIKIVNEFLDVSSIAQNKFIIVPNYFAISSITEDVVRELRNMAEANNVTIEISPDIAKLPDAYADSQRIKQVLYNLIGNALRFTKNGTISIVPEVQEEFIKIFINDTGTGISPENQSRLFRKFQQAGDFLTRDTANGNGLGLYISKEIIERSGGQIGLAGSEVNKGSSFFFTIPRVQPSNF